MLHRWASPQYGQSVSPFHLQSSPVRAEHPFLGISLLTALDFGFHILLEQHSDRSSPPPPGPANQAGRRRGCGHLHLFHMQLWDSFDLFLFVYSLFACVQQYAFPCTSHPLQFQFCPRSASLCHNRWSWAYPLHQEKSCKPWLAGWEAAVAHKWKWVWISLCSCKFSPVYMFREISDSVISFQRRDAHIRSPNRPTTGELAVGRLLITFSLLSRFCPSCSLADRWSMNNFLCIYYCLLFIYAKLFNEYFTWVNFSLSVCNELSFD